MGLFSKSKIKRLKRYAESGLNRYQYELAECYHYGKDIEQDYKEAFKWYVEASRYKTRCYDDGKMETEAQATARYMVAIYYAEGRVVQKNLKFAVDLLDVLIYEKNHQENGRDSLVSFIDDDLIHKIKMKYNELKLEIMKSDCIPGAESFYKYCEMKNENEKTAMELFMYSASKGYHDAIFELFNKLKRSYATDSIEFERMLELCYEKAKNRSAEVYRFLADFYSSEYFYVDRNKVNNTRFDYNKAIECYKEAAALGDLKSANELGDAYYFGKLGLNKDLNKAMEWFLPVANRQYSIGENCCIKLARERLGMLFKKAGEYMQAIQWYEKALELPWYDPTVRYSSNICRDIGMIYLEELNQREKAVEWFKLGIKHDGNIDCKIEMDRLREVY